MSETRARTGGCQCGAVRYVVSGPIRDLFVCHCDECKKQSGSAFAVSAVFARVGFRLTQGAPRLWTRLADSGRVVRCLFCETCGSRIWHEAAPNSEMVRVRGGSFDEPLDIAGATHIWTSRRLAGVVIPEGAPTVAEDPG